MESFGLLVGFLQQSKNRLEIFPSLGFGLNPDKIFNHLLGMIRWFYFGVDFYEVSLRINEEAFSFFNAFIFSGHLSFRISQQVYGESIFVPEFLVARYTVLAHSKNNSTHFLKLLQAFAESPGFNRSTRGVVFGIKEQ